MIVSTLVCVFYLGISIIIPFIHLIAASWPHFSFLPRLMSWLLVERHFSSYFGWGLVFMVVSCKFFPAVLNTTSAAAVIFHAAVVSLPTVTSACIASVL